ncbi:TIGR04076 family protein [Candidatus Bathyarchaeota archaeon]|nr:TIGR04076 family protein [Candidatus Bathyarchaeota archaeon]
MYKAVFEVVEVNEPRSLDGEPTHVSGPCKIYRVGDRVTVTGNPGRLVLEETDGVCLAAFSAILPLTSAMCREVTEPWDYMDKIKYYSCPDSERPVVFRVTRVPVEHGEVPLRKPE